MKKTVVIIMGMVIFITIGGCKKNPEIITGKALNMNISLDENVMDKSGSAILTLALENSSPEKLVLHESSFMLEFTSYSGSVKKTLYIDPFGDIFSFEKLPHGSLEIEGNSVLSGRINLNKIVFCPANHDSMIIPSDDYTINLIINARPDPMHNLSEGTMRSNYEDIQIKG